LTKKKRGKKNEVGIKRERGLGTGEFSTNID